MNEPRPTSTTIVDVAREAGVSHSTVSRVLNGRPSIKPETRTRVLAALERLGYAPNLSARSLAGGRLGVVGIVVLDLESSYITQVVRGVDAALADAGWDLMLCTTHRREQRETSYVSRLSVGLVDGLLVLLPKRSDEYAEDLASRSFPFVLVDHSGSPLANSIVAANHTGGVQAIEHLASLGHRRIGVITGDLDTDAGRDRLEGSRSAIERLDLDTDPALVVDGDFLEDGGYDGTKVLLGLEYPPTALLTGSDTAAFGALRAIADAGLVVPGDISVIGFDDIPEAALATPQLTTVRQPLVEMGRRAVEMLLAVIDDPSRPVAHVEYPTDVVVRRSTAPWPTG